MSQDDQNAVVRGPNYNWQIEAEHYRTELDKTRKLLDRIDAEAEKLCWERDRLVEALIVAKDAINELQTSCTHDEEDDNYRLLGDTYGWCSTCQTKMPYKENYGRDALLKIQEILK